MMNGEHHVDTSEPEVAAIQDEGLEDPDGHAGYEVEQEHDLDVHSFSYEDEEGAL